MKKTLLFIVLNIFNLTIIAQDAGISDPIDGLIIHEDNRNDYILTNDLDEMRLDGWSVFGTVASIKVYVNDSFDGNVNNPSESQWIKDVDIFAGELNLHLIVRCNYTGCAQEGYETANRTITYVKPFDASDFYLSLTANDEVKITYFPFNTANFWYQIIRSTSDTMTNFATVGTWTQNTEVIDFDANEDGQTYYYWINVAMDSNGTYRSGIMPLEYRQITLPTLSISDNSLSEYINIFPNPTTSTINIQVNNKLKLQKASIYNLQGKLIKTFKNNLNQLLINSLNSGLYFIKIETNKGTIVKKIIKK